MHHGRRPRVLSIVAALFALLSPWSAFGQAAPEREPCDEGSETLGCLSVETDCVGATMRLWGPATVYREAELPAFLTDLPAGQYQLKVACHGFLPDDRLITVRASDWIRLRITLRRERPAGEKLYQEAGGDRTGGGLDKRIDRIVKGEVGDREGFYFRYGIGAGSGGEQGRHYAALTFHIALGVGFTDRLLLGFEYNPFFYLKFRDLKGNVYTRLENHILKIQFTGYPTRRFYLHGGVGTAITTKTSWNPVYRYYGTGVDVSAGLGWDFYDHRGSMFKERNLLGVSYSALRVTAGCSIFEDRWIPYWSLDLILAGHDEDFIVEMVALPISIFILGILSGAGAVQ